MPRPDEIRAFPTLQTGGELRCSVASTLNELNGLTVKAQAAADLHALGTAIQAAAVAADASAATNATAPVVSSRTGAFAALTITITYDKALHPSSSARAEDFVISSPTRAVASVAINAGAGTVTVTYTGAQLITADSPDIAFTNSGIRGVYGTPVASFTAAAVTVAGS